MALSSGAGASSKPDPKPALPMAAECDACLAPGTDGPQEPQEIGVPVLVEKLADAGQQPPGPDDRGDTSTITATVPSSDLDSADEPVRQEDFNRKSFSNPTVIDNRFIPLIPGTKMVLTGKALDGKTVVERRVVTTVTDLTKVVNGVKSVVVWQRDFTGGQLSESELAFHAQDDAGNVWNLGEYPEEFEDGAFVGAPSTWLAGVAKAKAGILLRTDPRAGTRSYIEGSAPEIDFLDKARVSMVDQDTCVPLVCYDHVLVITESNPLEKTSARQLKFYAPEVGNVRVEPVNDPEGETLQLVSLTELSSKALARADESALQLDRRARRKAKDVYHDSRRARRS